MASVYKRRKVESIENKTKVHDWNTYDIQYERLVKEAKKSQYQQKEEDGKDNKENPEYFENLVKEFQKNQNIFYEAGCPTKDPDAYEIYTNVFHYDKYRLFMKKTDVNTIRSFDDYVRSCRATSVPYSSDDLSSSSSPSFTSSANGMSSPESPK